MNRQSAQVTWLSVILIVLFGFQSASISHAQELIRETFSGGDTTTNLLVYDSFTSSIHVDTVRDAVSSAMSHYDALLNAPAVTPPLEVMVVIESFAAIETTGGSHTWAQATLDSTGDIDFIDEAGDHVFVNAEICYLQVVDSARDDALLAFEIAHEIARCALANTFENLDTTYGSTDSWLVQSMAEYLATTLYPFDTDALLSARAGVNQLTDLVSASETIIGDSSLPTGSHYAGVYFWQYITTLEGDAVTPPATEAAALDLLWNYTGFSYDTDFFHPYLDTEISDLADQFSLFGVALAIDALAGQPGSDILFDGAIPTDLPVTDPVAMGSNFGLRFKQYSTFIDVPAIQVSVSALPEDSPVRIQVSGDSIAYQSVTPDAPVVLCKPDDEIILSSVVSRAYDADTFSIPAFEITYEPLEEYEDCEEDPALSSERDEEEEDTSCLVGEFELVDIPSESFARVFGDMADAGDIIIGEMTLTIDEFLNLDHQAQDFNVNTDMSGISMLVTMDIAVSGNFAVSTVDNTVFTVERLNYSFDSITALANIDGQTMDLSALASDMVSELGNAAFLPPARLTCTDFGLDYYVALNGIETIWGYHRIFEVSE